jgi:hypothetical protein
MLKNDHKVGFKDDRQYISRKLGEIAEILTLTLTQEDFTKSNFTN